MLKIITIMFGVLLLVVAVAISLIIYYFEADDVDYESFASHIAVPESIKKTPLIDVCEAPKFNWKGRDGESVPYISLVYGTLRPNFELIESYKGFFESGNCRGKPEIITSDEARIGYDCDREDFHAVDIFIEGEKACRSVNITFFENY